MRLSSLVFLLCAAAVVALIVIGPLSAGRIAPAGDLLDRVMANRAARIAILVFWAWLGWHVLVARTVDPQL
ncbi:MAG: hypothetical protein EPN91_00810 [Salinibacterium sp.]|nr:MAG: hypothetical protein EPN91_00810 [Salinibacterium sp.]